MYFTNISHLLHIFLAQSNECGWLGAKRGSYSGVLRLSLPRNFSFWALVAKILKTPPLCGPQPRKTAAPVACPVCRDRSIEVVKRIAFVPLNLKVRRLEYLYAMSPYHHVMDGRPYPAVMGITGVNDPEVPSWMWPRRSPDCKAATASDRPVLLSVDFDA